MTVKGIKVGLRDKTLLMIFVIGIAAGLMGVGTYSLFTATTVVIQTALDSGTFSLSAPAAGATNRLTLGAAGIVPGDTMQRVVDLSNNGGA